MMKMRSRESGFSLVTTIFILVVLVLLGSYMVTMVQIQNQSSSIAILGARADFMAYSGIEWGVKKALADDDCTNVNGVTLTVDGFQVDLTCDRYDNITEGAVTYNVFKIGSTASRGSYGNADFVSRSVEGFIRGN